MQEVNSVFAEICRFLGMSYIAGHVVVVDCKIISQLLQIKARAS